MVRIEDADALPFQAQELAEVLTRLGELSISVGITDDGAIVLEDGDREVIVSVDDDGNWDYHETEQR